jgi:opacity protein-like surface antigen
VKQQQITVPGGGSTVTTLGNGGHVRTITAALNLILCYPDKSIQPYVGVGLAYVNAKVSDEDFAISDDSPGLNLLAGLKGLLTNNLAVFGEVKYTYTSFRLEDAGVVGSGIKGVYSAPGVVVGLAWHFP